MIETHSETDRPVRGPEAQPAAAVPRRRPFGVNAIIVLLLISFVASVILGIVVPLGWDVIPEDLRYDVGIYAIFNAVLGVAGLIVAFGLLRLRRWAWYGVMILTGVSLLAAIWQYFRGASPYDELLLNSLITFYLNQRDVQSRFTNVSSRERAQ